MRNALFLALLALQAASQTTSGQEPKKGEDQQKKSLSVLFLQRFSNFALLTEYPSVQEEIKLTPAQKERLGVVVAKDRHAQADMQAKFRQALGQAVLPPREAVMRFRAAFAPFRAESEAAAMKILEPEQRSRLGQILLQAEGPLAFQRSELQETLNMDLEQIEMVRPIILEGNQLMDELERFPPDFAQHIGPSPPGSPKNTFKLDADYRKKFIEARAKRQKDALKLRSALVAKITESFTKKQRQKYARMLGEPFDLQKLERSAPLPAKAAE